MRETPRSQGTAGDTGTEPPQPRFGRALAHTTGASGSGNPHRSDGRSPHTPRGARFPGPGDCPGATPPAPGQSAFLLPVLLGVCALVFAVISWQVVADGPLRRADERLGRAVGHVELLNRAAEFFADLGGMTIAVPVLAAAIAYTAWRARREGEPRWWAAPLA
ncbi:hypothetical protein P8605_41870, partial [Streptomyces sp. T-3]|nr:hypothetical protein [Streptomyces sp. T-3]